MKKSEHSDGGMEKVEEEFEQDLGSLRVPKWSKMIQQFIKENFKGKSVDSASSCHGPISWSLAMT